MAIDSPHRNTCRYQNIVILQPSNLLYNFKLQKCISDSSSLITEEQNRYDSQAKILPWLAATPASIT